MSPLIDHHPKSKFLAFLEDFLNCVRTREKPQCNEDEAFMETATLLMSVEAYKQKRQVRWDPVKEEIIWISRELSFEQGCAESGLIRF